LNDLVFLNNTNTGFINFNYTYETAYDYNQVIQGQLELNNNNFLSNVLNQKNGLILANKYKIISSNLYMKDNLCPNCDGTGLTLHNSEILINNSIFYNNKGFRGGSLFLSNCISKMHNITINSGQAYESAGALYLHNTTFYINNSNF
jgi:hypothetical protein